jgi:hypothetical protein
MNMTTLSLGLEDRSSAFVGKNYRMETNVHRSSQI